MATDRPATTAGEETVPRRFTATLRVERTAPGQYRATQAGTDRDGTGPTPHAATVAYVRQAERSCFGPPVRD